MSGALPFEMVIHYTNYRGETKDYRIQPLELFWSPTNQYHPEPQFLLRALDLDRNAYRDFAIKDIHGVTPAQGSGARFPLFP